MLRFVLAVATAATFSATAAAAADSPQKSSGDRMVCRTLDESGSRTRSNRVCKTKSEWERAENAAKHEAWKMERSRVTPSELREPR
jgi:Ni/Co efflux regulator RcnB